MRKLALTALYLTVLALAACAQGMAGDSTGPAYNSGEKGGDGGGGGGSM
jgi:hypothetical protein